MYRALTLKALVSGVDLDDKRRLAKLAKEIDLVLEQPDDAPWVPARVLVDGADVTQAIRSPEVNAAVSEVARVPGVRREMVRRQRALARGHDAVVEGRDIGTVVFPAADVKVFLTAEPEERLKRRRAELEDEGVKGADERHARVLERDRIDSSRKDSPLAISDDATVIDTTPMDASQVVEAVLALCRERSG